MKLLHALTLMTLACTAADASPAFDYMLVASTAVPGSSHPPEQWGEVLRFGLNGTGALQPMSTIPRDLLSDPIGLAFDRHGDLFVGNRFANENNGSISHFSFSSDSSFVARPTITGNGLINVHDIAFSPSGELFAANRESDEMSRFVFDGLGDAIPNGTMATGLGTSHGVAFSNSGELFVAQGGSRINRFKTDPLTGEATMNGFFEVPGASAIRSLEFNAQNELFIPDHNANMVFRYNFDAAGNPIPNGSIDVLGAIGVAFSPEGELFVASHFVGGIHRFLFDAAGDAVPNGAIPTNSLGSIALVAVPEPSTLFLALVSTGVVTLTRWNRGPKSQLSRSVAGGRAPPLTHFISVFVVSCACVAGEAAAGQIYWTDVEHVTSTNATIRHAHDDGSGVETLFTGLSHVRGMTVDMSAQQMYWTSPGTGQILRANLDGTGPVHAVINDAGNGVAGVAVDAVKGKVYWTDFDTSLSSGTIRRSNLNGTDAEVVVTDAGRHPVGVALDIINGKVYWTDLQDTLDGKGRIIRSNLDGSNSETIITGIDEANGIAVDALGGKIYWPESTSGTIQCANLDGSDVQILVQGLDTPTTIGLDPVADKMYWTDALWEGEQWNRIERASFDGSSRETVVSDLGVPWGIAVVPEPSCLTIGSAGLVILALRRPSSRSPGRRQL